MSGARVMNPRYIYGKTGEPGSAGVFRSYNNAMPCPDWIRLVESCLEATKTYSDCLETARGLEPPQFDDALLRVEKAKLAVDQAEAALDQHEREHGCWRQDNTRSQTA
jgi:hypothetical protein